MEARLRQDFEDIGFALTHEGVEVHTHTHTHTHTHEGVEVHTHTRLDARDKAMSVVGLLSDRFR